MQIRTLLPEEFEQARLLIAANDWGPRVADPEIFHALLGRSQIALVAVEGTQVVGFLRAITEGMFNGYISMVVADEGHRGREHWHRLGSCRDGRQPQDSLGAACGPHRRVGLLPEAGLHPVGSRHGAPRRAPVTGA